jgi:hypothetical protein
MLTGGLEKIGDGSGFPAPQSGVAPDVIGNPLPSPIFRRIHSATMRSSSTSPRITQHDREGIRDAVIRACKETDATWQSIVLFGSRVDPRR